MFSTGMANPAQLKILTAALEKYCVAEHIKPGTPAYEDAGRLVMSLFNNGALTPDQIAAALDVNARPRMRRG